jgi:predicted RNase H-like nuclease (RuvC/YqgF family)
MGNRLKAVAKKAARKALTRRAPTPPPPPPPKAEKKEKKKMSEQIDSLETQVDELTQENEELRAKVAELERNPGSAAPTGEKKWVRGKLPGEKLIKTNTETGDYEEIDQAEFDSLV